MRLDPEILDGPPETGARILALARLADAEEALARLSDPKDREGSRALSGRARAPRRRAPRRSPRRSGARCPRRSSTSSRQAARAAAPAREPEPLASWLSGARGELAGPYRGALDWIADRVERRCRRAREEVAAEAAPRLRRVLPRLARGAHRPARGRARPGGPARFAAVCAAVLRAQTRALREAMAARRGPVATRPRSRWRAREARPARGTCSSPLRGVDAGAAGAAQALESLRAPLEAGLGALAAAAAVEGALLEARAEEVRRGERAAGAPARAPRAPEARRAARGGGAARARRPAPRRGDPDHRRRLRRGGGAGGAETRRRRTAPAAPPAPPERRFLVTAIPPEGPRRRRRGARAGLAPGGRARERRRHPVAARRAVVPRARAPGGGARGASRLIARADFDAFWPLTEGRRVAKKRHLVASAPGLALRRVRGPRARPRGRRGGERGRRLRPGSSRCSCARSRRSAATSTRRSRGGRPGAGRSPHAGPPPRGRRAAGRTAASRRATLRGRRERRATLASPEGGGGLRWEWTSVPR